MWGCQPISSSFSSPQGWATRVSQLELCVSSPHELTGLPITAHHLQKRISSSFALDYIFTKWCLIEAVLVEPPFPGLRIEEVITSPTSLQTH